MRWTRSIPIGPRETLPGGTGGTCRLVGASIRRAARTSSSPHSRRTGFGMQRMRWASSDTHERARQAAQWVRDVLWLPESQFFVYHPGSTVLIHNANLLGAALVRRCVPDDPSRRWHLCPHSPRRQRMARGHTDQARAISTSSTPSIPAMCSARLAPFSERPDVRAALERGASYYTSRFFDERGRAPLWPDRRYPEDAHSAGTALSTLALLSRLGLADRELLERVTDRVLSHIVRGDHAVHRRGRLVRSTVRYLRWCDAHVALGLSAAADLLAAPPPAQSRSGVQSWLTSSIGGSSTPSHR